MAEREFIEVDSRALRAALKKVDAELPRQLRKVGKQSADIVADTARGKAPSVSGRLRRSIVARADQTSASVKGGGARVPYFGFIDYGNRVQFGGGVGRGDSQPRPFIKSGRIVYPALADEYDRVVDTYERGVNALLREAGLT